MKWIVFVVFLGILGTIIPIGVSAGLFSSPVSANNTRSENIQTLPILEAKKWSPILLATIADSDPIIDQDSITNQSDLYTIDDIELPENDQITTYTVKTGDSLSEIASQFGVSTNTIRWANNIPKDKNIHIGQTLVILPITGVRHKVSKGDTLANIAKKYKSDADDIAVFNGIESNEGLVVGEFIIVPDGEINIPTDQIKKKTQKPSNTLKNNKKTTSDNNEPVSGGYYSKPVSGGILTQGYHDQYHALDISLPRGQAMGAPILAAASGTVIVAKPSGYNGGYGQMVIIQHDNGTQTLYAHMSSVKVSVGDHVNRGEVIGGMGSTGRSTGPHLHFEVRGAVTPMIYSKR
jgi:murein DD-endopeptidase MepM/ murein hydrolase activator NlpD